MGFFSLFKTEVRALHVNSALIQKMQAYAKAHHHHCHSNMQLFHRQERLELPLYLLDVHRGLYLFEQVHWELADVKDASVSVATPDKKKRDLNVNSRHEFVLRKFNEILHSDGCPSSNFVLLEHISSEAFESLHESFHQLMPKERIIFCDDDAWQIMHKLEAALPKLPLPLNHTELLGALFFNMLLLPDNLQSAQHLLSEQQFEFVSTPMRSKTVLAGSYGSGKSSAILHKAITELLRNPKQSVTIVAPTHAACEMLKKRLLQIIEYAIIDIELTSIAIVTPQQVIAQHYQKLYKKESFTFAKITPKMHSHRHQAADLLFCDDAYLMQEEFINYLSFQQNRAKLCLVMLEQEDATVTFENSFRSRNAFLNYCHGQDVSQNAHVECVEGNPYMHIMVQLTQLFKTYKPSHILIVVPHHLFAQKLLDELNAYYGTIAAIYQADEGLLNQEMEQMLIVTMEQTAHLQRQHVIVIDDGTGERRHLCHALARASESLSIIKDTHAHDTNERSPVESPTLA